MDAVLQPTGQHYARPVRQRAETPAGQRSGTLTGRPAGPTPGVRLTRRGRVLLTALMVALVLVALTLFSGQSAASGSTGTPVPTRTVEVSRGDTLWAIAADAAPEGDIREVVHQIEQLNALPGPALVEGQELVVPVG